MPDDLDQTRKSDGAQDGDGAEKPSTKLPGVVQKIIPSIVPAEPEKAQIAVVGADHLYRELRIENELTTQEGETVKLKPGAEVDVTIEADPSQTTKKTD